MNISSTSAAGDDPIEMNAFSRRRNSSKPSPDAPSATSLSKPHDDDDTAAAGGWSDDDADFSNDDDDIGIDAPKNTAAQAAMNLQSDEETGLTASQRARRRARRDSNARLDRRIGGSGGAALSEEEKRQADQTVMRRLGVNGVLILLWYIFSLSISLYNKWMFGQGHLNFRFPLFTTSMHMLVQFCLSSLVLWLVPSLRGPKGHNAEAGRVSMTRFFYLTRIGPCGAATGLDIGLGNMSLQFITLTFYTMCKSSSLAFVLMFAFIFRLEKPTWRLVGIIALMTLGVVMMVAGEVEFSLMGFCLVILAAFFSGFRWGLTQILLLRNPATSNPFLSIFFLAPVMFATLLLIAVPVEGIGALAAGLSALAAEHGLMAPLFLLFPGCIAFCMTAAEFALLQRTSVVTLSIAGIFKEVVTISAASLIFHDTLTFVNFVGLVVTMVAIGTYNYVKITGMRQEMQNKVHQDHLAVERGQQMEREAEEGREDQFGLGSDDEEDAALLNGR